MKAAIVYSARKLPEYGDFIEPLVDADHVMINVKAAAVSQLVKSRTAGTHYSSRMHYPFIAGIDGTGYLSHGEPVYFLTFGTPWGSMAERTLAQVNHIVPLPATLDPVLAAALANPGMSSWAALTRRAQLRTGETVLINGATGTSGSLAVRIAGHLGAGKIIATGRNVDALDKLRAQGADITLPLEALPTSLPALMAEGIDVVLDYLWGPSALDIMTAAAAGAEKVVRFVQIGSLSGQTLSLHSKLLRSSGLTLMGSGLGSLADADLIASIGEMFQAAALQDFSIPFQMRPLSDVNTTWEEDNSRCRTVFVVDR